MKEVTIVLVRVPRLPLLRAVFARRWLMDSFSSFILPPSSLLSLILALLDAPEPICYKNFLAPWHSFALCEGAYSAVAQWQSIRLLTGGL